MIYDLPVVFFCGLESCIRTDVPAQGSWMDQWLVRITGVISPQGIPDGGNRSCEVDQINGLKSMGFPGVRTYNPTYRGTTLNSTNEEMT